MGNSSGRDGASPQGPDPPRNGAGESSCQVARAAAGGLPWWESDHDERLSQGEAGQEGREETGKAEAHTGGAEADQERGGRAVARRLRGPSAVPLLPRSAGGASSAKPLSHVHATRSVLPAAVPAESGIPTQPADLDFPPLRHTPP